MNTHLENIKQLLQDATLPEDKKQMLLKAITEADKQWSITDFKLDRTEKVKKTTAILLEETIEELEQKRKAVEAQNRELEIESSLERVRTVAMSMNDRDDMLGICRIIAEQLELLKVKEIRNIQTAIFYKAKGTYMNYEYYAKHNKAITTETSYTNHEIHEAFANQMLKGKGEFFEKHINSVELPDWIVYQRTTNVFIDTYLEQADSLNYYWHSLGPVALGMSAYKALNEDELRLFKRFKNVFELAYRRYLDIEKAEAQAREAQIELALERVRARTMAMQHSDELAEASFLLDSQVRALGIRTRGCAFNIYGENESTEWFSGELGTMPTYKTPRENFFLTYYEAGQRGETFLIDEYAGEECVALYDYLCSLPVTGEGLRQFKASGGSFPAQQIVHVTYFKYGYLLFITLEPVPEAHDIFKRFARVFEQTYARFLDLKKAEAQTREAKIEASLERTRTQSMLMQHSKELDDTLRVFHEQVLLLGIHSAFSFLWLPDEKNDRHIFWAAWGEQQRSEHTDKGHATIFKSKAINYPLDRNEPATAQCLVDWKGNDPVVSYQVPPAGVESYFAAWQELIDGVEHLKPEYFSGGLYYVEAFMKYGCFGVMVATDLPEEEKKILRRFAIEFERTYTRFLDLQKAEAQAREAQIELGLERVRARAMAMQKSGELSELVDTVFKELTKLDFALTWCIINIIDESSLSNTVWAANPDINKAPESYHMLFEDYPFHHAMMKGWKGRNTKYVYTLEGSEKKIYDDYLFSETEFRSTPEAAQAASRAMEKYVVSFSFSNFGGLQTVGDVPLSDANLDILSRFGKVFDLTYTRFNDLKQAEAQAKESQIQLALERVRARTMAMHHSDELTEVVKLLYQEFDKLKISNESTDIEIGLIDEEKGIASIWAHFYLSDGTISTFKFPLAHFEGTMDEYKQWKNTPVEKRNELFITTELSGERWKEFIEKADGFPELSEIFRPLIEAKITKWVTHNAYFSHGLLTLQGTEAYSPETQEIQKRFAKVFEQTYTRFLDLQKAEAQAREAQIEAALERVRSRTMGMQKSEELKEVIQVVFEQFIHLNINVEHTGFVMDYRARDDYNIWVADPLGVPSELTIPYFDSVYYNSFNEAKEKGIDFFATNLSFDEKNRFYHQLFEYVPGLPEESKKFYFSCPGLAASTVLLENIGLYIENFSGIPYSDDENTTLMRFGKVFQQTYTRFLDLQKAEAQAREAQIEAALERVRSRTMGMQQSHELGDVATVLFKELNHLVENLWTCGFVLCEKDRGEDEWWLSTGDGFIPAFYLPNTGDPTHANIYDAWEKGETYHTEQLEGEGLQQHYDWLMNIPVSKNIFDDMKAAGNSLPAWQKLHCAYFSYGYLVMITQVPCPEDQVFKRFAQVFDQTYTRFLDLEKAETQAREAQIEAALERVRSRSMGMQKSEELREVIQVIYDQLVQLNFNISNAGFLMDYRESDDGNIWMADATTDFPTKQHIPNFDHPFKSDYLEQKEKGPELFTKVYPFEEKNTWWEAVLKYLPGVSEETKKTLLSLPALALSRVLMKNIGLYLLNFAGTPYSDQENATLIRFGKVFEQTYTRFNDLKKAEAQARESQIEAALERVRSRSMGMQKSEELRDVIQVIFEQFILLNISLHGAGFAMDYRESDDFNFWLADSTSAFPAKVHIPYFDHPQFNRFKEAKEQGLDFYANSLTFEEKNRFFNHIIKYSSHPIPPELQELGYNAPGYITSHVFLKNVALYILNFSGVPFSDSDNATLMRFGKVFEQTYTRFNDLKKAEAQALEAVKRASVDRLRAEIASMRTTNDLEKITPLVWNELTTLGVPFIRCGVFIMDEDHQEVQSFLSTPDGKAIAAFRQPYNAPGETAQIIASWHKKEMYKQHWGEAQLIEFTKDLVQQGSITSGEKYLTENRPADLYLHFLPFMQGMLYAGNTAPLSDDELQLMQNLADAFSTAYARYEDFNKLESANIKIERTLVDLKQAQAQLVQSEKMASLGELTAGIAHEIQNPLNFVNNFSEVNNELIEELKSQRLKLKSEELDEILNDIFKNNEKINHHGKRADAIVKGMLQHSRASIGTKEPTGINDLCEEYLRLSYHGNRAKDNSFNATIKTDFDNSIGKINIVPQDIGRVLLNLYNNAFYAVNEKRKLVDTGYEPTVNISTRRLNDRFEITVKDNGTGIPQKVFDKIFQPFFTTKPTGQGTGLGLSLSYDIVKAHGGELQVETKEGAGTEFIIVLPANN